jgi:hypothetical protein
MTTPPAPQPDSSASTVVTPTSPTNPNHLDPPAWRLVFLIVRSMLEGNWAKFVRSTVLLLLPIALIVLLACLMGPSGVAALGLGSIGTASFARHARTKGRTRRRPG